MMCVCGHDQAEHLMVNFSRSGLCFHTESDRKMCGCEGFTLPPRNMDYRVAIAAEAIYQVLTGKVNYLKALHPEHYEDAAVQVINKLEALRRE
jgi:hypothetical protein